jgi:lipoprotein-anchoring transpeptidase ErfK/SrfK
MVFRDRSPLAGHNLKSLLQCRALLFLLALLPAAQAFGVGTEVFVSVAAQELGVVRNGKTISRYPVSTSKFGIGDATGSYRTPLGTFLVSAKIGDDLAPGAVIKSRLPTREIVAINAPGRDAIVSRVIWLRGKEAGNRNAHERCIYIHGTPEEKRIGRRASFGCVRMRSKDVIALYNLMHIGMAVTISKKSLSELLPPAEPTLLERSD